MKDKFKGKTTLKEMAENWAEVYGEDLAMDYGGFYDELYEMYGDKKPIPLEEVFNAWKQSYGENIDEEYEGFWGSVGGKIPLYEGGEFDGGNFFTPAGETVDMPDEEAHIILSSDGSKRFSVSEFMAKKNPQPAIKLQAQPAAMKPEAKPMKEINLDQKLKESGTKLDKKTEGTLDKAFGIDKKGKK
jgi:hypothetical protein